MRVLVLAFLMFYGDTPSWERGNAFSEAYNRWAALRNQRVSKPETAGTVWMPEVLAWRDVESKWQVLRSSVKSEYR